MAGGAISTQDAKTFIIRSLWHFLLGRICIIGSLIPYRQICAFFSCPLDCLCDWRRQWCESKMSTKEMGNTQCQEWSAVCLPFTAVVGIIEFVSQHQGGDQERPLFFWVSPQTKSALQEVLIGFEIRVLMILSRLPTVLISMCSLWAWKGRINRGH